MPADQITREERELLETLKRVEALFVGTGFDGERAAAAEAMERIRERLSKLQIADPPIEFRFSLEDGWSRRLFMALLRRYGISPYRYAGQRRTTVMARVPARFVDETLWPEYKEISRVLREHLDAVTERVIQAGIFADASDAEMRSAPAALTSRQA